MRHRKKYAGLLGIVAVTLALALAACSSAEETGGPAQPQQPAPAPTAAGAVTQPQAPAQPQQPAQPAPAATTLPGAAPTATAVVSLPAPAPRATPTPTGEQIQTGGIFIPLAGFDLGNTDPHRNSSVAELSYLVHIYPSIIQYDTRTWNELQPDLASSWEVGSGGNVYTFKVRDGVTWSDGSRVTAEDMAYNLNRMIEQPNGIPMPRTGCIRGFMDNAQALDAVTLQVNLKSPAVAFLGCLGAPWIFMAPKAILEDVDTGADPGRQLELSEMIGAGPFKLKEYRRGIAWEVERSPTYYDQPRPYLDGVRHIIVTDPSSRVAAFRTGQAYMEAAFPGFGTDDDIAIRNSMGDRITATETLGFGIGGVHINLQKPPFNDVRVRRAMQLATDREAMIEILSPEGGEIQCYYTCVFDWIYPIETYMTFPGFRFDQKAEDIAEAKRLMADAGFSSSNPLNVTITARSVGNYTDTSQILVQQWGEIGMNLEIRPMESAAGFEAYARGDFEINWQGTGLNFLDPDAANDLLWLPTAGRNYQKWINDDFIALFDQEKVETDQARRGDLLRQMTDILLEDVPYIPGTGGSGFHLQWKCVRGFAYPRFLTQNNYRFDRLWMTNEAPCRQ